MAQVAAVAEHQVKAAYLYKFLDLGANKPWHLSVMECDGPLKHIHESVLRVHMLSYKLGELEEAR